MGKLSKYEKETIVNFNEKESEATIYTHNADLKRRLAEFSRKYPRPVQVEVSEHGERRHLCHGQVKAVYPSCTAI